MEYQIIKRTTKESLASDVYMYIQNGWKLQGGVSITYDPDLSTLVYAQAMIRP
jgi:hypothetical protein